MAMATRGSRRAAIHAHVARCVPAGLPHDVFNGRALGLGGTRGEGRCLQGWQSLPLGYARLAQQVSVRPGRRLSGSATLAYMAGNAIVSICTQCSGFELGNGG